MPEIDPVILQLRVDADRYRADVVSSTIMVQNQLAIQERAAARLEKQFRTSSGQIGATMKGLAATLSTAFTGREILGLVDSFTRLQNNLRVAGVEGEQLTAVQDRLFASAQQYGVELEALSSLFGSMTQASKELGASQDQIFKLTDAVSASLKITGKDAQSASGALLQLGQALNGGKIQAEEYNSLIDGLHPLLEAAAIGSDKWAGSVAKLTAAVKNGEVSSAEFFRAILNGADTLDGRAAKATLTLSAGVTTLGNALTVYFGEADKANGVSAAMGEALAKLAANVDRIIPAIAVLATAISARYVAGALAAGQATLAKAAADVRATVTANALAAAEARLSGLMISAGAAADIATASVTRTSVATGVLARGSGALSAMLGGPVGLAITALATGLYVVHSSSEEAEDALRKNAAAADEFGVSLSNASKQALAAADENRGVGQAANAAEPLIWSYKSSVDGLTRSLYEQAKAARAARVEMLQKNLDETRQRQDQSFNGTREGIGNLARQAREQLSKGDVLGMLGTIWTETKSDFADRLSGGRTSRDARRNFEDASRIAKAQQDEIERLQNTPIGRSDLPSSVTGAPAAASSGGSRRGRKGPNPEEIAGRYAQELARSYNEELALRAQLTTDLVQKANLERESIQRRAAADIADIQADADYSDLQKKALIAQRKIVQQEEDKVVTLREQEDLRKEQTDNMLSDLDSDDDLLRAKLDLAKSASDRLKIEKRLLANARKREEAGFDAILKSDTASPDEKKRAQKRKDGLDGIYGARAEGVQRDNESPMERYRREIGDVGKNINDSLEQVQVDGLKSLNDGLTDAIMNSKSLGDVFSNVARQIIADLIRIAIQQTIVNSLAKALGMGGGLTSVFGGGAQSNPGGAISYNAASGTNYSSEGFYRVGEAGPETVFLPQGSKVIPADLTRQISQPQGGGTVVIHVQSSEFFEAKVKQVSGQVAAPMAVQSAMAGSQMTESRMTRRARRRIG